MMQDCEAGLFDLVLFTKLDRFFRSVADYYEVQTVLEKKNVPWRAIWEDYETETSSGVLKVNIMLSVAQAEADRTSERIKAVNEYRRAQGKYVGKAPTGYMIVNSQLVIDESVKEAVESFFDEFEKTLSMQKAREAAIAKGCVIHNVTGKGMLLNSAYCGDANGYQCPAYISRETYERNKDIVVSRNSVKNVTRHTYLFNGLVRCAVCGGRLSGKSHKQVLKKGTKVHLGYMCTNARAYKTCKNRTYYYESKLEKYLLETLDAEIDKYNSSYVGKEKGIDVGKKRKQLENKLERIGIRFEEGDITVEEYKEKRNAIKAELAMLPVERKESIPTLQDDWKEVYSMLTVENKKLFWQSTIKEIYLSKSGKEYLFDIVLV